MRRLSLGLLFAAALLTLPGTQRTAFAAGAHEADSIRALITARRFAPAESRARDLARGIEAMVPLDSIRLGEALNLQAEAMWRGGQVNTAEAESVAARAVAVRERTLGPQHLDVATSLHNQANLLRIGGHLDHLDQRYRRVIAIRLGPLGPDHPDVARAFNDYGNLRNLIGDYSGAESLYVRACSIYERQIETQRRNVAACLNNLGLLAQARGDYPRARALLERSLQLFTEALGPDHTNVALACVNLAKALALLGEREEALRLLERALDIHVRTLGPEHADVAWNLRDLGALQAKAGDLPGARRSLERAIEIHSRALGPNHTETALDLSQLADIAEAAGQDSQAVALHTRALAINEQNLGPQHPRVAQELIGLGRLAAQGGDLATARVEFERALAIRRGSLGDDHPSVAETERALAEVQWAMGDSAAAFASALSAEAGARSHFRLLQQSLPERQALSLAGERTTGLDLATSMYFAMPDPERATRLTDAIVRSRAIVLDEMVQRFRFAAEARDPRLDTLAQRLSAARERLSNLSVRTPDRESVARHRALLDTARIDRERAERELAVASLDFRARQQQRAAGLDQVRGALPSGSTLIGYSRVNAPPSAFAGALESKPRAGAARYLAFVIRAGVAPVVVPLPSAATVDSLAARVRVQLAGGAALPVWAMVQAEREYRSTAATLRRAVWDPVTPYLDRDARVLIVPDGGLGLVDFAAFPESTGYLIERGRSIHYLSSERVLLSTPGGARGRGLLVIGGPEFGSKANRAPTQMRGQALDERPTLRATETSSAHDPCTRQLPDFAALPHAAREAGVIEDYWKRQAQGDPADTAIVLTGRAATEDAFRRLAPGRRVLHLATHGFVLGDRCVENQASAGASVQPAAIGATLGGLALTNANRHSGSPTAHDGVLTAEEIAALDLGGVEWTVLSACNTGWGEVRHGEGVFGLRRAFEVAGCRTLIMSLWPVSDQIAREWMNHLYQARFSRRLDTAAAVNSAGRALLERRRKRHESTHPWYWAGFIAAGDWR